MFHSAAVKLTLWYLAIIMVLSIGCSLALYHVSSTELEHNARRPIGSISELLRDNDLRYYNSLRLRQFEQDQSILRRRLIAFNLFILGAGGLASYALARRTLRPIEDALDSQKRFSGDASHELRTPLTAMRSEIEVALRNKNLTKQQAVGLLKSNLEEVNKLKDLSEGLLALTNNNADEPKQMASLESLLKQSIDRVAKVAAAKKIKIEYSAVDKKISAYPEQLVQLLSILLDNAIKYSPSGSKIKLEAHSKKDRHAAINVTDQGEGIAAADLPHIFERFYRADRSRSQNDRQGYGLGLALAKKIAELHGGHIEVSSTPGHGSTFTLII